MGFENLEEAEIFCVKKSNRITNWFKVRIIKIHIVDITLNLECIKYVVWRQFEWHELNDHTHWIGGRTGWNQITIDS